MAVNRGIHDELDDSWHAIAAYFNQATIEVQRLGLVNITPRIKGTSRGIVIDRMELIPPAVLEPTERDHRKFVERLLGRRPYPMK